MTRLAVLHLIGSLVPYGQERVAVRLAKAQAQRHRVGVLSFKPGRLEQELRTADVWCEVMFPNGLPSLPVQVLRTFREVRAFAPDIVHIHIGTCSIQGTIGVWLSRVPMVGHFHNLPSGVHGATTSVTPNKIRLAKLFFDNHNLIVLTPEAQKYYFEKHGLEGYIVPNAIDLDEFDRAMATLPQALPPDGTRKVLCPARLAPVKNHAMLLRAAKQVIEKAQVPVRFYLAGDGPLRQELENMSQDLGIAEHVVFLGYRDDMPALMRDCDVVCLPSLREGFPLVLPEAGAARKPCVVTDIAGPREVIKDGETGFVVPVGNEEALADALLRLVGDAAMRREMGEAARQRVEEKYSLTRQVELVETVYRRVLG